MPQIRPQETKIIYNRLKQSAKKRGIPFTISLSDINNLSFPLTCPILGVPLVYNTGIVQDNSYSIDRIDPELGYEPGNLFVISFKANRLKSDMTQEQIKQLCDWYC